MKIVKPSYEILTPISPGGIKELQLIEKVGRTCYRSEDKITDDGESAKIFVKMLINHGHEAMIEHSFLSVKFTVDRGVSHEIVRHRMASYAQESTRYCNYSKGKFGGEIAVIKPYYLGPTELAFWKDACETAEDAYMYLVENGKTPQEARAVLPTSLKTDLIMSANYREWRHFLRLRTAPDAHPQIREVCVPLLKELRNKIPVVFDDILIQKEVYYEELAARTSGRDSANESGSGNP